MLVAGHYPPMYQPLVGKRAYTHKGSILQSVNSSLGAAWGFSRPTGRVSWLPACSSPCSIFAVVKSHLGG